MTTILCYFVTECNALGTDSIRLATLCSARRNTPKPTVNDYWNF